MKPEKIETIDEALTRIGIGKFHIILLLITGFIHACDSMEMMILVFLGPFLTCYWKITLYESSVLTATVFIGTIIGSIIFGKFSDQNGRRKTLIISNFGLLIFGLLCAASPTFSWLIFIRFLLGISIGGNASSQQTLMSEMTPIKHRGTFMILFQVFWVLGSYLITIFSFFISPVFGWRLILVFVTIPVIGVLMALLWVPESPRILLLQEKKHQCIEVINKIAKTNDVDGISDVYQLPIVKSSYRDLIHPNYLSSTIIISFVMFVMTLSYCSILLLATIINAIPHKCLQDMSTFSKLQTDSKNNILDDSCCFEINWETYKSLLISTTGELVILPVSIILINIIGRKTIITINSIVVWIGIFLLNFCFSSIYLYILLFFIRGSMVAFLSVTVIYATEIFPTSVRGLGSGICGSCGRIGAILSPFLVNVLIAKYSFIGGTMLLCGLNIMVTIASLLLPYETKDKSLLQTANDENTISETTQLYKRPNYN